MPNLRDKNVDNFLHQKYHILPNNIEREYKKCSYNKRKSNAKKEQEIMENISIM